MRRADPEQPAAAALCARDRGASRGANTWVAGKGASARSTLWAGGRWAKAKAQAERAVRDVAGELLAIQAARESQPGHALSFPMFPWQREFESAFLYEETPDQMRAHCRNQKRHGTAQADGPV